jgi:hypothetical protein
VSSGDGGQRAGKLRHLDVALEYRRLHRRRLQSIVDVREPLVIITQIQRSGGTLLSRLFDGHPACHVHPSEIHMGGRHKLVWPELRLDDEPAEWFELLYERKLRIYTKKGYSKAPRHLRPGVDYDIAPFLFSPSLQRDIFLQCIGQRRIEHVRDVFDCYMTSLFNAWLDNQNLYGETKKAIIGFAAGFGSNPANLERFFEVYDDGLIISIVRDPRGWLASAQRYQEKYSDIDMAIDRWRRSTAATLEAKARWRERVAVVSYEDLVLDTERVMKGLAGLIGVTFSPALLSPSFNRLPIRANSSEPVRAYGILPGRATAHQSALDAATASRIERAVGDLYEQARAVTADEAASRVSRSAAETR